MPTTRVFQPAQPGCIEIVFHFVLFGIPLAVIITVCLDSGVAPTPTELGNVATVVDNWMHFDVMSVLSTDLFYTGLTATDISISTGGQVVTSHGAGIAGSVAISAMPSQIAAVVTLYTALRGKSYRGRSYLPGIPQSYQSGVGGVMNTSDVGVILTAYNVLNTRLSPIAVHQAVLSRRSGGVKRTTAIATGVTSRTMDNTFDTQRRRGANAHR